MPASDLSDLLREGWRYLPVNPQSTPTQLRPADLLQSDCEPGVFKSHCGRLYMRQSAWRLPGAQGCA
jgi:hypothetical protein